MSAKLVREYLETLLPEDWDGMDLFDRRSFLAGVNNIGRVGTVARTRVCNMEIWCELLAKTRAALAAPNPTTSQPCSLSSAGTQGEKGARQAIRPQFVFVPGDVPD